jgi:hypothetical protein
MYFYFLFYRLPDTDEKRSERYRRDKGAVGIHGATFEYKFCALIFARMKNIGYKFKLASNVEGLGAFDDVFVEYLDDNYRKKYIFVQLRSKIRQRVTMEQLLAGRGDFSLRKYYESYIQIEEKFNCSGEGVKLKGSIDDSLFIIYTNVDVGVNLKSYKVIDLNQEEFLMTDGSVLLFNEEEHPAIYKHLQDLPKHREFLSRFRIFCGKANDREMDGHIKRELQQIMKLHESEVDIAYVFFRDFITDWWQNSNCFLQDTNTRQNDPLRNTLEKLRPLFVPKKSIRGNPNLTK